ncbi:hypothetical protein BC936DRAFT_141306, partial [Jimgerdemannia flammicorona]
MSSVLKGGKSNNFLANAKLMWKQS